jgi:YggT family protein
VFLILMLLYYVLLVFFILMIGRLIFDVVQSFSPQWRPRGAVLVLAEVVYTPTDPPLKALRSVLPPLTLGGFRLDLAFLVIMLLTGLAMNVVQYAAVQAAS